MGMRPSRRDFLHVGFCGGIGLTLADYFALKAKADIKKYESKEGTAKSVIFIYLPGGAARRIRRPSIRSRTLRSNTAAR